MVLLSEDERGFKRITGSMERTFEAQVQSEEDIQKFLNDLRHELTMARHNNKTVVCEIWVQT